MNRRYPLMLPALAVSERMPIPAVMEEFELTRTEVLTDIVLFRDLLVYRAREQGFVHEAWTPSSTQAYAWMREISYATAGSWTLLLSPKEREELKHVRFIVNHVKKRYRSHLKGQQNG